MGGAMTRAASWRLVRQYGMAATSLVCAAALHVSGCAMPFDLGEPKPPASDLPSPRLPGAEAAGWIANLADQPASAANPPPTGRFDPVEPPARRTVNPPATTPTPTMPARLRKVATEHLGQWTARAPNPVDTLGFSGTDLGISFPHRGELWFLFGDSQSVFDFCSDSLARVPLAPLPPGELPKLEWLKRPSGLFAPITVPGIDLGFMNVPVEAISIDDEVVYLFLSTQWSDDAGRHAGSAVAHSDDPRLDRWVLDHAVETTKFVNVSVVREGPYAYIWGSGEFRKSDVYLARTRIETLGDRDRWEYLRSWDDGGTFGPGEDSARPVVDAGCVGELSVRRHPRQGSILLAYNCDNPRGVFLRTADQPLGPYSEPILLFEPWLDDGYEHFMHISPDLTGRDDGLSEATRETTSGGEYGPYLVPEWFSETPDGTLAITYTLSSWNPYQVHVMRTLLADANAPLPPAAASGAGFEHGPSLAEANLALTDMTGWQHTGDGYAIVPGNDGAVVMTSEVQPLGAAATGTMWRDFRIDDGVQALEFDVQGGDAEVLLVADDEVVRRVRGRGDGTWRPVIFKLGNLRGKDLRLALYDRSVSAGGYVAVRNLRLR